MKIGILALQGDFLEHQAVLHRLNVEAVLVRLPGDLASLDGLIIPGGESTAIGRLARDYGLWGPVRERAEAGWPVFGTCAGMILMAQQATDLEQGCLGLVDIAVRRNAFGRQVDSFEVDLPIPALGEAPFHAIFIRAPLIENVGPEVQVLARLPDGMTVAAQQGKRLVTAFHPELTRDLRFHAHFLNLVADRGGHGTP